MNNENLSPEKIHPMPELGEYSTLISRRGNDQETLECLYFAKG